MKIMFWKIHRKPFMFPSLLITFRLLLVCGFNGPVAEWDNISQVILQVGTCGPPPPLHSNLRRRGAEEPTEAPSGGTPGMCYGRSGSALRRPRAVAVRGEGLDNETCLDKLILLKVLRVYDLS